MAEWSKAPDLRPGIRLNARVRTPLDAYTGALPLPVGRLCCALNCDHFGAKNIALLAQSVEREAVTKCVSSNLKVDGSNPSWSAKSLLRTKFKRT